MNKNIYTINNLTKIYDNSEHHVLDELSFSLKKGKFSAITGPSGVGKSTLLNLLGMLDKPTGGEIQLDGQNLAELTEKEKNRLRRDKVGFIFQFHHLISELDAAENVMVPLMLQGENSRTAREKASQLLVELGLDGKQDKKPAQLSGGERQRVAIGRAIIHHPDVILGDEISGNLDTETSLEIINLLKYIQEKHSLTMIMVTHDELIAHRADEVYLLQYGKISKKEDNQDAKK